MQRGQELFGTCLGRVGRPRCEVLIGDEPAFDVAPEADDTDVDTSNDYDDFNSVHVTFDADTRWADKDVGGGQTYSRNYSVRVTPRNQLYTRNLGG